MSASARNRAAMIARHEKRSAKSECYSAAEIAGKLGLSIDAFYEQRERLHAKLGMPRPTTVGRIRIPKLAFDAWMNRDHPDAPKRQAANDVVALPAPATDDEHRTFLHFAYSGTR